MNRRLMTVAIVFGCFVVAGIALFAWKDVLWPPHYGWGEPIDFSDKGGLLAICRTDSKGDEPPTCECQILIVPPEELRGKFLGPGHERSSHFEGGGGSPIFEYTMWWRVIFDDDSVHTAEIEMIYDRAKHSMTIGSELFDVEDGNVFCIMLDDAGDCDRVVQLNQVITEFIDLDDMDQLIPPGGADLPSP